MSDDELIEKMRIEFHRTHVGAYGVLYALRDVVRTHDAEQAKAFRTAELTAERERADRAEAELGQWKQAAELARDDHQHEYGRANALEMCVDRLESELMAAQVEARLWNEAVKDRRVLPIGSYYGPDDKVPVRQP